LAAEVRAATHALGANPPIAIRSEVELEIRTMDRLLEAWAQSDYSLEVIANPAIVFTQRERDAANSAGRRIEAFVDRRC
jgi:hypothetical protein